MTDLTFLVRGVSSEKWLAVGDLQSLGDEIRMKLLIGIAAAFTWCALMVSSAEALRGAGRPQPSATPLLGAVHSSDANVVNAEMAENVRHPQDW